MEEPLSARLAKLCRTLALPFADAPANEQGWEPARDLVLYTATSDPQVSSGCLPRLARRLPAAPSVSSLQARVTAEVQQAAQAAEAADAQTAASAEDASLALALQLSEEYAAEVQPAADAASFCAVSRRDSALLERASSAGARSQRWELGWKPPSVAPSDDATRLRRRLQQYGLEEGDIRGDGCCQFRALADQLYRSEAYHGAVRAQTCAELAARPERYSPFVIGDWQAYLAAAARPGTWGDHVTLQAAADAFGCTVCVVTSYAASGYLEVAPLVRKNQRALWVALHAEVHYTTLYPAGEVPLVGCERVRQLGDG